MLTRKRFKLQQELENDISRRTSDEEGVELSQERSDIRTLTWQIPHFNALPLEVDYNVDSDQLVYKGTGWRIRTYPNGMSGSGSKGWIYFMMRKTSTLPPAENVSCGFGIKDNSGQENIMTECIYKKNDLEMGPIKLLQLSEACKNENNFLQGGTITMVCRMQYVGKTEAEASVTSGTRSRMRDEKRIVGFTLEKSLSCQVANWEIPHFSELPTTVGYFVGSPTFSFKDATCCMWLYPNGRSEDKSEGWICMKLEIVDLSDTQQIQCKINIGSTLSWKYKRSIPVHAKVMEPFKLLKRSEVNNVLKGDSFPVVCLMGCE